MLVVEVTRSDKTHPLLLYTVTLGRVCVLAGGPTDPAGARTGGPGGRLVAAGLWGVVCGQ